MQPKFVRTKPNQRLYSKFLTRLSGLQATGLHELSRGRPSLAAIWCRKGDTSSHHLRSSKPRWRRKHKLAANPTDWTKFATWLRLATCWRLRLVFTLTPPTRHAKDSEIPRQACVAKGKFSIASCSLDRVFVAWHKPENVTTPRSQVSVLIERLSRPNSPTLQASLVRTWLFIGRREDGTALLAWVELAP